MSLLMQHMLTKLSEPLGITVTIKVPITSKLSTVQEAALEGSLEAFFLQRVTPMNGIITVCMDAVGERDTFCERLELLIAQLRIDIDRNLRFTVDFSY